MSIIQDHGLKPATVSSVEILEVDETPVFDFEVEDNHNFFVRSRGSLGPGVLVHNCHLAPALETSRVLSQFNARYRVGLTATPERKQELLMNIIFDLFGVVIYEAKVDRLVPFVETMETGLTFKIKPGGGDAEFARFINRVEYSKDRIEKIATLAVRKVREGHMVLLPLMRVRAVEMMVRKINEIAEERIAAAFHGQVDKKRRPKIIDDARNYKIKVLVGNQRLISTGLNIPRASCLIECFLSNNMPNAEQRTARILTVYDGKPQPVIVYVLDNCEILQKTRRSEWWGCIHPRFRPKMTQVTRQRLMAWFSSSSTQRFQESADAYQL